MLIHRLVLRNFRQHADTVLELGPGLTGITGPNGAGKSTLLEAIGFALYGVPATRGQKDSIRRRGAPPRSRTEVELAFALGGRPYRIVRSLTTAELYQDGADAPLADSLATVTQRVERLLGMTREEFYNTYFTGQKELAVMASMGPTDRGKFLSSVLGYEKLEAARLRNREQRREQEAHLAGLRAGQPDPALLAAQAREASAAVEAAVARETAARQEASVAAERLARVEPRLAAIVAQRAEQTRLDADRRAAAGELPARAEAVQRASAAVTRAASAADEAAKLQAILEPLPALRAEAEAMAVAAAGAKDRAALADLQTAEAARLAQLDAALATLATPEQVQALIASGRALRALLEEVERRAAELRRIWTQDAQEAATKVLTLGDQLEELRQQYDLLAAAGDDGLCPTCRQPLRARREEVLQELADKRDEVRQNLAWQQRRVEQLKEEPAELREADAQRAALQHDRQEALRAHTQQTGEVARAEQLRQERPAIVARLAELAERLAAAPPQYDAAAHAELKARLAALEAQARQHERLAADAARLPAAHAELAAAQRALAEAEAREQACSAALAALGFDATAAAAIEAEHADAERAERTAALALVQATGARTGAEAALAQAHQRVTEAEAGAERIAEADRGVRLRAELDRAFGDLRTDLNAQLRPELAELASGFLRELTQGRYLDLELDEQYTATVLDDGEPKPVISGGEDDVVNLALRLAISQMIAERAGQPLSLLVLDEIFGSLDEGRRGAVLELLRSLADRFPQVILITHVEQLREGVDRLLRVEFDAASRTSRVREDQSVTDHVAA